MKKIVSIIAVIAALFSANYAFAAPMPLTKEDADLMVTVNRNAPYMANFNVCKSDSNLAKAAYRETYEVNIALLKAWIAETSKTRAITAAEKKELMYIQNTLQLEARSPKFTSWMTCDMIASDFDRNTWDVVENFASKGQTVSNEYKKAVFDSVKPGLSSFNSTTLGGKVAVVRSNRINSFTNDYASYKGIVVEVADANGKVLSHFVFVPQNEINGKKATINGFPLKYVTSDQLAKIYMTTAPGMPNAPSVVAPVKKVGKLFYAYKQFK